MWKKDGVSPERFYNRQGMYLTLDDLEARGLSIPNLIPEVPDLNPSQKVMDFLADILALVSGINFEEMRLQLINWLVEQLQPLSEDLSINFVKSIKSCYACKINPKIPEWLYQIQPSTIVYDQNNQPVPNSGTEGVGFNVELNKIDLNSNGGKFRDPSVHGQLGRFPRLHR